ncbi:hypothetical protein, partial [Paraburkholderia sp. NMBU_R16]|uniref:hypothetical protein n=1 Tax=Paraburkholderia sp. NMBU_R16 TaxID=2698676 RepID=UPI001C279D6A
RFSTLPAPVGNVERAFFVFAIIDVLRFNSHRFYSSSLMRQSPPAAAQAVQLYAAGAVHGMSVEDAADREE